MGLFVYSVAVGFAVAHEILVGCLLAVMRCDDDVYGYATM